MEQKEQMAADAAVWIFLWLPSIGMDILSGYHQLVWIFCVVTINWYGYFEWLPSIGMDILSCYHQLVWIF
jgi:hypothetical protein